MGARGRPTEALGMQIGSGELAIDNQNGIARLTLSGDFDLANVPELERVVSTRLWPAYPVLGDLRQVSHLDLQLLRWLQRLQRETTGRDGRLLVIPSAPTRRLLAAARLSDAFDLVEA
jgi:anti-anti-sigma factor